MPEISQLPTTGKYMTHSPYVVHWNDGNEDYVTVIPAGVIKNDVPEAKELVKAILLLECTTLDEVKGWEDQYIHLRTVCCMVTNQCFAVDIGADTPASYDPTPDLEKLRNLHQSHGLVFGEDEKGRWDAHDGDGHPVGKSATLRLLVDKLHRDLNDD